MILRDVVVPLVGVLDLQKVGGASRQVQAALRRVYLCSGGCTCRDCPFPSWLPSYNDKHDM